MLKIFNTLTRRTEVFQPIEPGQVRMYVCGMTVYDRCHLGHARMLVNFDLVYRWLQHSGYQVTYVRNITDIDDKIIARAALHQEPISALTTRMISAMHQDLAQLNVLPPTFEPRATDHVSGMITMISTLIERQLAYVGSNGDVYYSVHDFPTYGKLSGKTLEDLRAGERISVDPHKRDPLDFVLWKAAKPDEPSWPSPWGPGRPGWHIECSVMSEHFLGTHFDIHGGGHDLQFPHHENEIAQSEGAHGHTFVNLWMHNGFLRVNDEKMSKSLDNFFTIDAVLEAFDAEVIRFFLLRGHYRSPLNYTEAHLEDARQSLNTLYNALRGQPLTAGLPDWTQPEAQAFKAALDDDFNTPEAMAVLFGLARDIHRGGGTEKATLLLRLGAMMGLLERDPEQWMQQGAGLGRKASQATRGLSAETVEQIIEQRAQARKTRNFAESDRLRQLLLDQGVILEDSAQGTSWRRV